MRRLTNAWAAPLAAATVLLSACALSRSGQGAAPGSENAAPAANATAPAAGEGQAETDLAQLQQQLAARDSEIAGLKSEVSRLREREAANRQALDTLKRMLQARAALPYSLVPAPPGSAAPERTRNVAATAAVGREPPGAADADARRGAVAEEVAALRAELEAERQLHQRAEAELERLRQETAAGPFESGSERALQVARGRIAELERELGSEKRAREELTRRYQGLRQEPAPATDLQVTALRAEIEAMRQAHQEAVGSLERDLAQLRLHERQLLAALAAAEKAGDNPSADAVAGLRAENTALRTRLETEHQQNRELAAKLKMASRVADLVFKMRVGEQELPAP